MKERYYQTDARLAAWEALKSSPSTAIVIPTGGGKTPVIAGLCIDAVAWGFRVCVVQPSKELIGQTADTLRTIDPTMPVGVYSASLRSRDLGYSVTVCGIQSIFRRSREVGPIDVCIIDEAHLIPPSGEGQYRTFLEGLRTYRPGVRVVGLTATPYRLGLGSIAGEGRIFDGICHEVGVRALIDQGYLSPLKTKATKRQIDTSEVKKRGGEFVASSLEQAAESVSDAAIAEAVITAKDRRSILVFTCGVTHATHVADTIRHHTGEDVGVVTGETLQSDRDATIARFKSGRLRWLVNVNVLTTGFDAPNVDCVVLMRPTESAGLYYQMVGRGFRKCEGKADCLVLDFGGNARRHGPVDTVEAVEPGGGGGPAPTKECPDCATVVHTSVRICPDCGHEYPFDLAPKVEPEAATDAVLSTEAPQLYKVPVEDTHYSSHTKKGGDRAVLRVEHAVGFGEYICEWVCIEHEGYAHRKARNWWAGHSNNTLAPMPATVDEAMQRIEAGGLRKTLEIWVEQAAGQKWPNVTNSILSDPPKLPLPTDDDILADYEEVDVPF